MQLSQATASQSPLSGGTGISDTPVASGVLAVGFGVTVAMWAVGYVGRLPALVLSSPLLLALLLACLVGGGVVAGRTIPAGWRGGAYAGTLAGLLNLLVLGSLLAGDRPNEIQPSALLWVPGSIAVSALLGGLGAAAATRWPGAARGDVDWPAVFVRITIAATLLLLAVGGLVTSKEVGLAVVDWPNSYGYNMFLYPLSRMTGGIYYEHAHRLFGALVGLTTLVLAVFLQRVEARAFVRRLGWLALAMVVVQGILGGLRVTELSLTLAVVHGVLAQLFFGTLVALGAFTTATWRSRQAPVSRPGARTDHVLGWILVGTLIVQLVLGAIQRHTDSLLMVHIGMAAVVAPLAFHLGFRTWGLNLELALLRRLGLALAFVTSLQVVLGLGAFMITRGVWEQPAISTTQVLVTTLHQWCGAVLLACAVLLLCWNYRLITPKLH